MSNVIGKTIPANDLKFILYEYLKVNDQYFYRNYYREGIDIVSSWGLSQKYFPQITKFHNFKNYVFKVIEIERTRIDILFFEKNDTEYWKNRITYDINDFILQKKDFITTRENYIDFIKKIKENDSIFTLFNVLFESIVPSLLENMIIEFYQKIINSNILIKNTFYLKWLDVLNLSNNYFEFKIYIYWFNYLYMVDNIWYLNNSVFYCNIKEMKKNYHLQDYKLKMLWTVLNALKKPILEKM